MQQERLESVTFVHMLDGIENEDEEGWSEGEG